MLALLAAATTGARAGVQGTGDLDVEIAIDSTGSMGPLIDQTKRDAETIIAAVQAFDPDARFAVVEFRDPHYPAPEYQVLQSFSSDVAAVAAAIGRLNPVSTDYAGNVPSEAYNLVFEKSVTDTSLGWRQASRKVVVVLGDGEPHGAGLDGLRGCRDTNPDPHGLDTLAALAKMRAAARTLLMVRNPSPELTLDCYASIAALAGLGGAARDAGSTDLAAPIGALLEGTAFTLTASAGLPLALPGTTRQVTLRLVNAGPGPARLDRLELQLPAGTSFVPERRALGSPAAQANTVTWHLSKALASGEVTTLAARIRVGRAGRTIFKATAEAHLADGRDVTATSRAAVRVGRTLRLGTLAGTHTSVSSIVMIVYGASASSLVGKMTARGLIELGSGRARIAIVPQRADVTAASGRTATIVSGSVLSSGRKGCTKGMPVKVLLVDHDALEASSTPDVFRVLGRGCATKARVDVTTS